MRASTFVFPIVLIAAGGVWAPAIAEPSAAEQSLVSQPDMLPGAHDPASLVGREQYAVDIRLYDGERLLSETSIALIEGLLGVIDSRKTRMEDTGGKYAVPCQYLNSLIVLDAGPERCWPEMGDTRQIVADALEQAELVRVGPVSIWIFCPGAERYEVKVRRIKAHAEQGSEPAGLESSSNLLGEDSGCLPYVEPLEPEELPANAESGGGGWWKAGS